MPKKSRQQHWREQNRERDKENQLRWYLSKTYGITLEQYKEYPQLCAICGNKCSTGQRLCVDHNHTTGKIRGLLCRNCNAGLGKFKDSPELLKRAIAYVSA